MLSRYTVTVEAALGADLTADPATWTWTDISTYVRLASSQRVAVSRGRPDKSNAQPAQCTFRLSNVDGRFTPRFATSPYYGQWGKGTPIRVKLNPGTGAIVRFQGNVSSIVVSWPTGRVGYCEAAITAQGSLWRLGKGRVLRSPLYRLYATASGSNAPDVWWPLEDGATASQAASGLMGGAPLQKSGIVGFGASATSGAASLVNLATGGTLFSTGTLPSSTAFANGPGWTVDLAVQVSPIPASTPTATVMRLRAANGSSSYWDLLLNNAASGGVKFAIRTGGTTTTYTSNVGIDDGETHHIRIVTSTNFSLDVVYSVTVDGVSVISQTVSGIGFNNGTVRSVALNPLRGTDASYPAVGHLAVGAGSALDADITSATAGWSGELASDRVTRLCGEEGVPVTVTGTSNVEMGAQRVARLVDLLGDCADADAAILADGVSAGLVYVSAAGRYDTSVALALDTASKHLPVGFESVEDDSRLVNDATASRTGGSSAQYTNDTSITDEGDYDGSESVNVADDTQLLDQASWAVHQGTVPEMRAPTIPLSLVRFPTLVASWLACSLGARYTVASPPSQYGYDPLDLVLDYYTEEFDHIMWSAELTGSPFAPWRVIKVADSTYGRWPDTAGSYLPSSITSSATSCTVSTSDGSPWTTSAVYSADFPFSADLEGEQVTVTACANAGSDAFGRTSSNGWGTADSGQAWTTSGGSASDYSVSGGKGLHSSGSVNVLRHTTMDIGSADQDFTIQVSLAITSATTASVTQWVLARLTDTSNYYVAQLTLDTARVMSLQLFKRVAGSLSSIGNAAQVSTALHNGGDNWAVRVSILGTRLRAKAWLAAATEPVNWILDSTDTSLTTGTLIGAATRLETGNTNTLPVVSSWDNLTVYNPQTFTLTRSANGVVKAHSANAPVKLWKPVTVAL